MFKRSIPSEPQVRPGQLLNLGQEVSHEATRISIWNGLMSIALVTTKAAPPALCDYCRPGFVDAPGASSSPSATLHPVCTIALISEDKVLGSAYYDTVSILSSKNPCSDFFGGPDSVVIFSELVSKIRKDSLAVGMEFACQD